MSNIKIHNLKTNKEFFEDIISNNKRFTVRRNDRPFKIGDIIQAEEVDEKGYTGRYICLEITYILDNINYCPKNHVIIGYKLRIDRGITI